MVVDIGGGTTEIDYVTWRSCLFKILKVAGDALDQSIIAYMRKMNLMIETPLLRKLKKKLVQLFHQQIILF